MPGYGQPLLLDWSAYTRVLLTQAKGPGGRRLSPAAVRRFDEAVIADELYVCTPFRLEALYSTQSASDYDSLAEELDAFRPAPADADTWRLAEHAQRGLSGAKAVSHRVKLADLLVASIAHQHGIGVLHYDRDYATIAAHSSLTIRDVWIAEPGSID